MTTPDSRSATPSSEGVSVQRFSTGGSDVAVFEFQGRLRDLMVSSLETEYLTLGNYSADAKAISAQGMLSMAIAGSAAGTTAVSAALSPTLYMATADPTTLMKLGNGVGSAVMGTKGIAGHAPFLAVPSALPIVAPIMAMQALTTIVVLKQFHQVDQKLDVIKNSLDKAIARAEATHAGKLLAASEIFDELYKQYEQTGDFSTDMLIRLSLTEQSVREEEQRFRYLVESSHKTDIDDIADLHRSNYDAHSAMLASFLGLRIAYLRICVDMQENPRAVQFSVNELKKRIKLNLKFWRKMLRRSKSLRAEINRTEAELDDMSLVERSLPVGRRAAAEKKLEKLKKSYTTTLESEREIMEGFDSLIQTTKHTLSELENPVRQLESAPTLVYWRDEAGEHSFYTDKFGIS